MSCEIVIEIGNSHEGSLGIAKSFVEMVAESGARIIKFQMHLPDYESTELEPFRMDFSDQDQSRISYWKRTSFSENEWKKIISHCEKFGIEFMCTPFSIEAAQLLFDMRAVKRWKVGSGDASNLPLLDFLVSTQLPIIISTGLVSWEEILFLKNRFIKKNALGRITFLHCVSEYPTPIKKVGFNLFRDLMSEFGKAGFSDHSGNVLTGLYAISQNASILEVHMTPHKSFFGPDTSSSLTPDEIKLLCRFNEHVQDLNANHISKNNLFKDAKENRRIFRKGIYWSRSLVSEETVSVEDICFRKPVVSFDAIDFEKIIDRKVGKNVKQFDVVLDTDFEKE